MPFILRVGIKNLKPSSKFVIQNILKELKLTFYYSQKTHFIIMSGLDFKYGHLDIRNTIHFFY